MELYFLRHGIAAERSEYLQDAERPLTPKGKQRSHQVARRLRGLGLDFDAILTSPLLRAKQTADILFAEKLGNKPRLFLPLAPGGSLDDLFIWLKEWRPQTADPKLIIVGHQPDLGTWAEAIAFGQKGDNIVLKKAGIIGIRSRAVRIQAHTENKIFLLTSPKWLLS